MPQSYNPTWARPSRERRCVSTTRSGNQCRAWARPGSDRCHVHDSCGCRKPRTSSKCAVCGWGAGRDPNTVCGKCHEAGWRADPGNEVTIIKGTARVSCDWHAPPF